MVEPKVLTDLTSDDDSWKFELVFYSNNGEVFLKVIDVARRNLNPEACLQWIAARRLMPSFTTYTGEPLSVESNEELRLFFLYLEWIYSRNLNKMVSMLMILCGLYAMDYHYLEGADERKMQRNGIYDEIIEDYHNTKATSENLNHVKI